MARRPEQHGRVGVSQSARILALLLGSLALLGLTFAGSSGFAEVFSPPGGHPAALQSNPNGSGGSDPPESSTSGGLCASGGPVILGVDWNCVAVLNLTELLVILGSVGIVLYVFKDADRAELPGEAAEVPVTSAEWDAYRRARQLGIPYVPPASAEEEEE